MGVIILPEYVREYWDQMGDEWVRKMPSAFRAWFRDPGDAAKAEIAELIEGWTVRQIPDWEAELAKQVERLAVNEAKLQRKVTKTAQEEVRKATDKIAAATATLQMLAKPNTAAETARIFPQSISPIIVWENGRRVVKMMRFQCRAARRPLKSD